MGHDSIHAAHGISGRKAIHRRRAAPLSLISSVGTLFFPFKDYAVDSVTTNMVEASRFVDLFPLGIILAVFGMIKRKKWMCLVSGLLQS